MCATSQRGNLTRPRPIQGLNTTIALNDGAENREQVKLKGPPAPNTHVDRGESQNNLSNKQQVT